MRRRWVARLAVALLAAAVIAAACGDAETTSTSDDPPGSVPPTTSTVPPTTLVEDAADAGLAWWHDRVFYEVFVRSFADSDGDGRGDLRGLIDRLDYLNDGDPATSDDLGVTGIWLMPVAESPSYHGYDVVDYRTIEADYGTNQDFLDLMTATEERGIAVIVDLVLNHTSRDHPWFVSSRVGDEEFRDWYLWADSDPGYVGPWGQRVWHRAGDSWYYGVFWEGMPDLDLENAEVTAELYDIARFWLDDMGADGFRLDAALHYVEEGQVQDGTEASQRWLREFNSFVHGVAPMSLTVGEVWAATPIIAQYADEVDLAFQFNLAEAILWGFDIGSARPVAQEHEAAARLLDTRRYAMFLANHDQTRVMTRLRGDIAAAKAAATLLLTDPGVPFLYYGEEVGMVGDKPDERLRTPMPWQADTKVGFTTGTPWERPQEGWETANVATQTGDPDSLLSHYRRLIRVRNEHPALRLGGLVPVDTGTDKVYAYLRGVDGDHVLVVVNFAAFPLTGYALDLPAGSLPPGASPTALIGPDVDPVTVAADGSLVGYVPLPDLAPRQSLVIHFTG